MLNIKKSKSKKNLNKRQINAMWNMINKWLPSDMTKEEFVNIIERTNGNPNAELPQEINYAMSQFIDSVNKHRTTVKINMKDINDCFEDADEDDIIEKNKENIDKIMSEINNEKETKKTNKPKKLNRYARDPYTPSIFTDVLTIYCCLSKNAQKGFDDEAVKMYKNNNPEVTTEEMNKLNFAEMVSTLSDEQLAKLKEAIQREAKKDQSTSKLERILNEQPEVDIEKKLIPVEPTKEKDEPFLTEEDKKEIWGMIKVGGLTIIILTAIFGIKRCSLYKTAYENSLKNKGKKVNEETDPTQSVTYENPVGDVEVEKIYEADGIVFASYEDYLEYENLKNQTNENAPIMYVPDDSELIKDIGVVNPDGTYTVTEMGTTISRTYESYEAFRDFDNDTDCWLVGGDGIYYRMEKQKVKSK